MNMLAHLGRESLTHADISTVICSATVVFIHCGHTCGHDNTDSVLRNSLLQSDIPSSAVSIAVSEANGGRVLVHADGLLLQGNDGRFVS
jgi:hypothetical protein